jgi:hypothetical protein
MKEENFMPLITLGIMKTEDDRGLPAAWSTSALNDIVMTESVLAGLLISVVEAIVNTIPESEQIQFEKKSIRKFNKIVKERELHMERFDVEQDNEGF